MPPLPEGVRRALAEMLAIAAPLELRVTQPVAAVLPASETLGTFSSGRAAAPASLAVETRPRTVLGP